MSDEDFWGEEVQSRHASGLSTQTGLEPLAQEPQGCVGTLTMEEVHLDQLRQALYERVEHAGQIPDLLRQLSETDWAEWFANGGARIVVCSACRRYLRAAEAITLPEMVWLGDNPYCPACAERMRAAYTYMCEACGHDFYAQRPPAPFSICPECDSPGVAFALSSLWAQLQRARKLNLPATLTPREWLDTLEYFGWRCAYCQQADFACLDHFVPIVKGGGTTQSNCVPACVACNSAKGGKHPQGYLMEPDAYMRVAQYLAQFE